MGAFFAPLSAKIFGGLSAALLIALGVLWLLYSAQSKRLEACRTNHAQFVADVKAKTELARISDLAHKAEVERNQETERANHEAEIQHLRTDYAGRVREYAKSHPGRSGITSVSQPAKPSSDPAPASAEAIVPVTDLEICASNTAAAEGWLAWWKSVQAIPR